MDSGKSKIKIAGEHILDVARVQFLLELICKKYNRKLKRLYYQNVSRESIVEINKTHLNHNYETDIITFDYSINSNVDAEIVISPQVIALNATNYATTIEEETGRVYIHGLLHIIGFDDKSAEERTRMRKEEDYWLSTIKENE